MFLGLLDPDPVVRSTDPEPYIGSRIRRIRMFFGLLDPDPVVRGTDPEPSIGNQAKIVRKILIPTYCFVTSL